MMDFQIIQNVSYIIASALFILGIKRLGKESTAVSGNFMSALGMFIAVSVSAISFVDPLLEIVVLALGAVIGSVIAPGELIPVGYDSNTSGDGVRADALALGGL